MLGSIASVKEQRELLGFVQGNSKGKTDLRLGPSGELLGECLGRMVSFFELFRGVPLFGTQFLNAASAVSLPEFLAFKRFGKTILVVLGKGADGGGSSIWRRAFSMFPTQQATIFLALQVSLWFQMVSFQ